MFELIIGNNWAVGVDFDYEDGNVDGYEDGNEDQLLYPLLDFKLSLVGISRISVTCEFEFKPFNNSNFKSSNWSSYSFPQQMS